MTHWTEYTAVALNVAYIVLAARRSMWCWPAGIGGSALSIWLFIEVQLYAEAVLFLYYVVMGIYGWYVWRREAESPGFSIVSLGIGSHFLLCLLGYAGTGLIFWLLTSYTDAELPLVDAFTTSFAFLATWLTARKVLENWIYWIAVDSLAVYLYLARGLELYALLSAAYTAMAAYGYIEWLRNHRGRLQELWESSE